MTETKPAAPPGIESFRELTASQQPVQQILYCRDMLDKADRSLFSDSGIAIDPVKLEPDLKALYGGDQYDFFLNELAKRFVYLVSIYVYKQPTNIYGGLMEVLDDISNILAGRPDLVDFIIEDPQEAKQASAEISAVRQMNAQKALGAALSAGGISGNGEAKPS